MEDLPKVTSEMDDLVLGQNGFEVFIKKWHVDCQLSWLCLIIFINIIPAK
jgi:hypothetical protein